MTDPINPYADEPRKPPQRSDAVTRLDKTEPASPIATGKRQEERHVLHIELAMQNANLRQTQLELEAQLDRYIDLYEMAPIGYLTLNQEGVIKQANLTADAMLKSPRSDLLNRPFAEWVAVADWGRWSIHFQHVLQHDERDLLQGDSADNVELELLRSDGTLLAVRIDALCLKTAIDDSVVRIALTDISARKQAGRTDCGRTPHQRARLRIMRADDGERSGRKGVAHQLCLYTAHRLYGTRYRRPACRFAAITAS